MIISLLLSLMMMAGLFLLLWAGVGFIQNKRFFTSAPKEVLAVMEDKNKRFKGQHVLGYILAIIAILLMLGALYLGAMDGMNKGFTLHQFFYRFLTILLLTKAFDIIFFDWILLCNRGFGFFESYYPELSKVLNTHLFGFNKKEHFIFIIIFICGSYLLAWFCTNF